LAIGRNEEIIKVLGRLINQEWRGIAVTKDEEALAAFREGHFDIVLFSNGITAEEKAALETELCSVNASVIFIQHMGGGSGLLENEILAALDKRDKNRS
jgi:hypothetical protein